MVVSTSTPCTCCAVAISVSIWSERFLLLSYHGTQVPERTRPQAIHGKFIKNHDSCNASVTHILLGQETPVFLEWQSQSHWDFKRVWCLFECGVGRKYQSRRGRLGNCCHSGKLHHSIWRTGESALDNWKSGKSAVDNWSHGLLHTRREIYVKKYASVVTSTIYIIIYLFPTYSLDPSIRATNVLPSAPDLARRGPTLHMSDSQSLDSCCAMWETFPIMVSFCSTFPSVILVLPLSRVTSASPLEPTLHCPCLKNWT